MTVISKQKTSSSLRLFTPLFTRTVAFVLVFILLSGAIGPRIINKGLVNKDGFQIYGGAGKALLFGVLALLLLIYRQGKLPPLMQWHPKQVIWLLLAALSLYVAWISVDHLIRGSTSLNWILLAHGGIVASVLFAAGATFGPSNLRLLSRTYKHQILTALSLAVVFLGFLYIVYSLWRILATVVLHSVSWLLGIIGIHSTILPPRTLLLNKFGINVAQYCSGIESIALFTGLYALIGVLDWGHFNHMKLLWIFPGALIVLFMFNILRVFILILGGYYINPQIAFSLFHTYAGMLFFILYSLLFWAVSYRWMLQKDS